MADTISLGGYIINFLGTQCTDDLQTWNYSITKKENPMPEITSFALELCYNPLHNVIASQGAGSIVIGPGKPCIPLVGRTIKWENLNNDNVEGTYSFTLEGCYKASEKQAAVFAGPFCHRSFITGPDCEEEIFEEAFEEISEYASEDTSGDTLEDTLEDILGETSEEIFEGVSEDTSVHTSDKVSRDFFEEIFEEVLETSPKDTSEETRDDTPPPLSTRGIKIF